MGIIFKEVSYIRYALQFYNTYLRHIDPVLEGIEDNDLEHSHKLALAFEKIERRCFERQETPLLELPGNTSDLSNPKIAQLTLEDVITIRRALQCYIRHIDHILETNDEGLDEEELIDLSYDAGYHQDILRKYKTVETKTRAFKLNRQKLPPVNLN